MAQARNKSAALLNGPVAKTLLAFAAPLFVTNLFQTAFNIIDMIIVGQWVGPEGLSGVSVGSDIVHFLLFFGMGLSTAGQVIISQHLGGGALKQARVFIGTFLTFVLVFVSGLTVLSLLATPWALGIMNTPPEAYDNAYIYTMICVAGMPLGYLYNAFGSVMRSHGDSKNPMYFMLIGSTIHVALAFVFMVYLDMGVMGAALSTVLGQASMLLMCVVFLVQNQESYTMTFSRELLHMDKRNLISLLKLGIPMALQSASISISRIFVNSYINSYGLTVSAATGVNSRIVSVSYLYSGALGSAVAVMVGHALGANNPQRVRRIVGVSMAIGLTCSAVFMSVSLAFPEQIFGFFTNDADVLTVCMEYVVPFLMMDYLFAGFRCTFSGMINGSAKPLLNYAVALFDGIIGRILLSILFGAVMGMGYQGFWLGSTLAGAMPSLVGISYMLFNYVRNRKQAREQQENA